MNYDHNKNVGLLKFQSGYRKFYLDCPKGYCRNIINAQTNHDLKCVNRLKDFVTSVDTIDGERISLWTWPVYHIKKHWSLSHVPNTPTCACQKQIDPQFKGHGVQALVKTVRTLFYALHFYSVRSVHLQSFKLIPFRVLMLCPGQSSKHKH